ncbi:MAG: winged helix-turn-helix transcriptional regulator [Bacteroidetes bacterium]|nr:MAG: winged helix-turn-helix transcriptional regulator [Bacteroidota bacterium]
MRTDRTTPQNTHPAPIDGFDYRRIDIAEVRKHLNQFVKDFNQKAATPKERIRGGLFLTLLKVCDAYVRQNNRVGCLTINPIPCRMNNVRLAHLVKVDKRTILNHLSKLEQMGIVQKTFRGTKADYELTVPAWILLYDPQSSNNTLLGNQPTADSTENTDKAKNVRQSNLVNSLEKSNIHSIPCELGDNGIENNSGQPPLSADTAKPLGLFSCTPLKADGCVENPPLSTDEFPEQRLGGGAAAKKYPAWQLAMVLEFYRYAISSLYPYHQFDKETERKIKNKLFNHVYGSFKQPLTRDGWEKYQQTLIQRVDLIAAWKERPLEGDKTKKYQQGKFIVNPITFFDNKCPYGFIQTEQWLLLQYKRKALIKAELELDKARKELLTDTDRLKVYRKWETRFKNKKLPEAEVMFYHAMTNIQKQWALQKQRVVAPTT